MGVKILEVGTPMVVLGPSWTHGPDRRAAMRDVRRGRIGRRCATTRGTPWAVKATSLPGPPGKAMGYRRAPAVTLRLESHPRASSNFERQVPGTQEDRSALGWPARGTWQC